MILLTRWLEANLMHLHHCPLMALTRSLPKQGGKVCLVTHVWCRLNATFVFLASTERSAWCPNSEYRVVKPHWGAGGGEEREIERER